MSKVPVFNHTFVFERTIDERIAILEMLLWKNHISGIPVDVFERLIKYGFMIKDKGGHMWSDLAIEINNYFNECFNYQ